MYPIELFSEISEFRIPKYTRLKYLVRYVILKYILHFHLSLSIKIRLSPVISAGMMSSEFPDARAYFASISRFLW